MAYCLKGEIIYSHAPLEEAFERIGRREKGVLGELFIQTAGRISSRSGETFANIWEQTIEEMEKNGKKWKMPVPGERRQRKTAFLRGTAGLPGYPDAGTYIAAVFRAAGAFYFQAAGGDTGKMQAQYSTWGNGQLISGDHHVLEVETMDVNLIFRIAAVGILVSVICQVLKHSGRDEQAFLTSLAGLIMVLFWMVPYIYDLFETMKRLFLL